VLISLHLLNIVSQHLYSGIDNFVVTRDLKTFCLPVVALRTLHNSLEVF